MQYKSVRSSSKVWVNRSISQAISAIVPLAFLLSASTSWALSAVAVRADNTTLSNNNGYTLFYPTSATGWDGGDIAVPRVVDNTMTYASDPSGANALYFTLNSSTATFTPPNANTAYNTYLMAFVSAPNAGANLYPIPIAFYTTNAGSGVVACEGSGANCGLQGTNIPNNVAYHFAVPYSPTQTVQVGFYPQDICYLYGVTGFSSTTSFSNSSPCIASGDGVTGNFGPIPANNNAGFKVTFYIVLVPTSITTIDPRNTQQSTLSGQGGNFPESAALSLSFQPNGGTINPASCPSGTDLNSVYYPGDKRIYLDTTKFSTLYQVPTGGSGTGTFAAASALVVVANSAVNATPATPDDSQTGFSNSIFARSGIGGTDEQVSGFTNSVPGTSYVYSLSVLIRDYAGFVNGPQGCRIPGVQATEVAGFLRDSKCFIATAAFQSKDAAPVAMLREFRDQVLLNSELGQAFVDWYYRWSPPAAEWLIEHPQFRYPILLALVPVEIFAWLCLRPLFFLLMAMASIAFIVVLRKRAMAVSSQGEIV
ncbi:MAG: CFI-box-CTERM domain-containing protein [Bdellovibrionia bacterium]